MAARHLRRHRHHICTTNRKGETQMKRLFALVLTLGLMAGVAYAHNGMEHVMGTVASTTDTSITVATTDGKSQTVTTTADTKYTKMDASIALKDIKIDDHVISHATKNGDDLNAATRHGDITTL